MNRYPSVQTTHLRLESIEDGIVRLTGGQECAVLEVNSINVGLQASDDQEALLASYAAVLNSLSFPIQILVRAVPIDIAPVLDDLEHRAHHELREPLASLAHDQAAFLRRLARQRTLLERRFYLVVPARQVETLAARRIWPLRHREPIQDRAITRQQLASRSANVARQLGRCGLTARRLGDTELTQLYYACWCPELARSQRLRRALDLNSPVVHGRQHERSA